MMFPMKGKGDTSPSLVIPQRGGGYGGIPPIIFIFILLFSLLFSLQFKSQNSLYRKLYPRRGWGLRGYTPDYAFGNHYYLLCFLSGDKGDTSPSLVIPQRGGGYGGIPPIMFVIMEYFISK
jgi:hypothetical protein